MGETLTAGEVAQYIRRPDETESAAIARFRNWEKTGIIKALGKQSPGTGHHKQYSDVALAEAILLQTLTDALGAPAVSLSPLLDKISRLAKWSIFLLKDPRRAQEMHLAQLLVLYRPRNSKNFSVSLLNPGDMEKQISKPDADVHIVINIRSVLERVAHNWSDTILEEAVQEALAPLVQSRTALNKIAKVEGLSRRRAKAIQKR